MSRKIGEMTGPGDPDPGGGGGTIPSGSNGKQWLTYEYNETDAGPYRVIVQLNENRDDAQINKLAVGKILTKTKEYKVNVLNLKIMGKNKVLVLVKTPQTANKIQADKTLRAQNYKAYIPKHFMTVAGVVTGVPLEMTPEEIFENITCNMPILSVTRLHKYENDNKIPTTRIAVTFRCNQLPLEVRMFCCTNQVKPFVSKAVFCQNCLRYNHRTNNCRSRQRCETCGRNHDEQGYGQCTMPARCLHCRQEGHKSGDANCPERERQNNLKVIMAKTNLTTLEAQEQYPIYTQNQFSLLENIEDFPTLSKSYAKVSQLTSNQSQIRQIERNRKVHTPKRSSGEATNTENIGNQVKIIYDKKRKTDHEQTTNGVALFNRYKTDEFEKFQWKLNHMREAAQKTHEAVQQFNTSQEVLSMDDDEEDQINGDHAGLAQVSQSVESSIKQRIDYNKAN